MDQDVERGDLWSEPTAPEGGIADRMLVDDALAQLPMAFRAAVVLRDLCDMDYAEIAEVLGVPGGTVRSRIARGRAHLADLLGPALSMDDDGGGNQGTGRQRPRPRPDSSAAGGETR